MAYGLPWQAYTFLGILILLLSFAGVKVGLPFLLRRRREQEAIRNGTYVPQTPLPSRPACVDLSKKPQLWEAYLGGGGGGWRVGSFGKKELDIETNWKIEYSTDWECIKPIYAGYAEPLSGSTPNLTSLSPPVSFPVPAPINHLLPRGDDEENQRRGITEVSASATTTTSLLTRARRFFNHNFTTTLRASSSTDNGTNSGSFSSNISMTELVSTSPSTIRVAVLIAMPSPSSRGSLSSSTPRSASLSSNSRPTTSHSLELSSPTLSPSPSPTTLRIADSTMEEKRLPHLEMGVADVVRVVVKARSEESSTWNGVHTAREDEEKTTSSQGSSFAES